MLSYVDLEQIMSWFDLFDPIKGQIREPQLCDHGVKRWYTKLAYLNKPKVCYYQEDQKTSYIDQLGGEKKFLGVIRIES